MVNLQRLQAEARALKLSGRKALKKDVYALIQKQKSEDDYSSFKETLLRTDTKLLCQREVPHLLGCSNATSPGRLPIPQLLVLSSVLLLGGESGLPCCITLPRCPSIPSKIYAEIWRVQWQCWVTGTLRDGLLSVGVGWQEWPCPSLPHSFFSFFHIIALQLFHWVEAAGGSPHQKQAAVYHQDLKWSSFQNWEAKSTSFLHALPILSWGISRPWHRRN